MKTYTIKLRPNLLELESLFAWLETIPLPQYVALQPVALICEEVFCNIVTHAYDNFSDPQNRDIEVSINFSEELFVLKFSDFGLPFISGENVGELSYQSLEERPLGGIGWPLIRHFSDDVQYQTHNDNNVLTIKKLNKGVNHGNNHE
jgi:serine/threonine-protein kinase RsbW